MFMVFPFTWVYKLQYQISLVTMELEYTALSQSVRELIGDREVIKEIQAFTISGKTQNSKYRTCSKALVLYDIPPSKFYEDH